MENIRDMLEEMKVEKADRDKVMAAFGKAFNPIKADLEKAQADLTKARSDLEEANKDYNSFYNSYNDDQESFKAKYEAEVTAHSETKVALETEQAAHIATRTDWENKESNATIDRVYGELLTASGLDPALHANEMKLVNRESLVLDKDGAKFKDADKILADAKMRWPETAFAKTEEGGVKTFGGNGLFAKPAAGGKNADDKPNLTAMLFTGGGDSE